VARRLQPEVLGPLSPEQAASVRRWLWLVAAMLGYTVWGWVLG